MIKRHVDFLREKGSKGYILLAAPFADRKGGCILWRIDSLEKADRIAKEDPFFEEGNSDYALREWNIGFNYAVKPPVIS